MEKTTQKQKIVLIFLGIFLGLLIIELSLRGAGLILMQFQKQSSSENKENYVILTIGESTTAGYYNSWPRELERILNNRSRNIKFSVINEGRSGTNTALILSRLDEQLDKYNPDMVITMMGVNDEGYEYTQDNYIKNIKFIFKQLRIYKLTRYIFGSWKTEFSEGYQSPGKENNYSKKCNYNIKLAWENIAKEEFEDAISILENSKDECQPNDIIYYDLGTIYSQHNLNLSVAISMYEKAIEINPQSPDWVYLRLAEIYRRQNVPVKEVDGFLHENGFPIILNKNESVVEPTRIHYNKLYEKLKEREITYVAMQYPTLDVRMIKG
ncbi:MAG: GDSL-type esterase/lipase family protein, partial [Nanoarchaeota archaeon]